MGNCCGRSSSMVWAENDVVTADESSSSSSSSISSSSSSPLKKSVAFSGGGSMREVKIKITKKELEDLLCKAELQGLSSEQVLTRLITASDRVSVQHDSRSHNQSWQPSLKSIPELN